MKENILIDKSIEFAARIIKLQRYLLKDKKENVISKHKSCIFAGFLLCIIHFSLCIIQYSLKGCKANE